MDNMKIGDRFQLHPACDLWMRGARFGEVIGLRSTEKDRYIVRMDKLPRQKMSLPVDFAAYVCEVIPQA